jgi:hypothetical protein
MHPEPTAREHSDPGRIARRTIDRQLPTPAEKATLRALQAGILILQVDTTDVSSPPTDAELDAAFGQPADVGAGFIALLDDAGAGSAAYIVFSDGTNWWYVAATRAT